jgi:hypothetical protein
VFFFQHKLHWQCVLNILHVNCSGLRRRVGGSLMPIRRKSTPSSSSSTTKNREHHLLGCISRRRCFLFVFLLWRFLIYVHGVNFRTFLRRFIVAKIGRVVVSCYAVCHSFSTVPGFSVALHNKAIELPKLQINNKNDNLNQFPYHWFSCCLQLKK